MPKVRVKVTSLFGKKRTYQFCMHEVNKARLYTLAGVFGVSMSGLLESLIVKEFNRVNLEESTTVRKAVREAFSNLVGGEISPSPDQGELPPTPEGGGVG